MRHFLLSMAFLLGIIIVMPALLVRGCGGAASLDDLSSSEQIAIRVYLHDRDEVAVMGLEEYVAGVVAAEMPASFGLEALKAQAIAARTFAVKRMRAYGGPGSDRHPEADISTDPAHDQAWISTDEMRSRWGFFGFRRWRPKIEQAVRETEGLVVRWGGLLVDPVYHSTCGGRTEDSENVWSDRVPYLRGVADPFCAHSPFFRQSTKMTYESLSAKLGPGAGAVVAAVQEGGSKAVSVLEVSPSGRVMKLRLGEAVLDHRQIRSVLGLRSTNVSISVSKDGLIFQTSGFGHGVGLCQYGADGMSKRGFKAEDIIRYYYSGVQVEKIR